MHKFLIGMTGQGRGMVFMDGKKLDCVTRVSFNAATDELNHITVTMVTGDIVVEEAEVVIVPAE